MTGKQSDETSSARLRAFTRVAACDDVSSLSDIRHEMRRQVGRGDPAALLRIDEYSETAKDELIAAQEMAETSREQDRALTLAHRNAVTRLQFTNVVKASKNHKKQEEDARGGGVAAAAVSYSHIASGRWSSQSSELTSLVRDIRNRLRWKTNCMEH